MNLRIIEKYPLLTLIGKTVFLLRESKGIFIFCFHYNAYFLLIILPVLGSISIAQ